MGRDMSHAVGLVYKEYDPVMANCQESYVGNGEGLRMPRRGIWGVWANGVRLVNEPPMMVDSGPTTGRAAGLEDAAQGDLWRAGRSAAVCVWYLYDSTPQT